MTYDFSGIGRNNKSDIVSFFSFRHWGLFTGITRNPEVLFHAIVRIPLGRAANSRFSTSRMKKKGREKKRERERETNVHVRDDLILTLAFLTAQKYKRIAKEIQRGLGLSKASIITTDH